MMDENTQRVEGKTTIAPDVLLTIIRLTAANVPGFSSFSPVPAHRMQRLIKGEHLSDGIAIQVEDDVVYVDMYVIIKANLNVREISRNLQNSVARSISEMVGMQAGHVNIHIENIDYPSENEA